MNCISIQWKNFRNLKPQRLDPGEGLHLLYGSNGAGKTNVLEALHVSMGWGPLDGGAGELVNWDKLERGALIAAEFRGEEQVDATIGLKKGIHVKKNGSVSTGSSLRTSIPSLVFLPNDLSLVEGAPSVRRKFLDRLSTLLFPLYATRLYGFRRILRQKNFLLKTGKPVHSANRVMAPLASWIWSRRMASTDLLAAGMEEQRRLLPGPLTVSMALGASEKRNDLLEEFWHSIRLYGYRETELKTGVVGPHRDDLLLECRGRNASEQFSRGHRKRVALSLLLAAAAAVETKLRRKPVLLLDEIMAELDMDGRKRLLESLQLGQWQTFVASAETEMPRWPGSVWNVQGGTVEPGEM
ncbi:MAG: DNA replication and repair protein RecF [Synergistota bacterium]|nr:DNA replication and repair protein RecF [Synergistota bacterium]